MTKKILFSFYERWAMIDYLKFPNEYNGKPLVFLRLEILKFRRELDQKISPYFLFIIDKFEKLLK